MEPYRIPPADPDERSAPRARGWDVVVVLGILLVASLVRVIGAFVRGETFGPEATLASLVVLLFVGGAILHLVRRIRARVSRAPNGSGSFGTFGSSLNPP